MPSKSESTIRQDLYERLAEDLKVSGVELEYLLQFVEANVVDFSQSISRLATLARWDEIAVGAEKLRALAENTAWAELAEVAFSLGEGAKQQNRVAVAAAHHRLRGLLQELTGSVDNPAGTAPVGKN